MICDTGSLRLAKMIENNDIYKGHRELLPSNLLPDKYMMCLSQKQIIQVRFFHSLV